MRELRLLLKDPLPRKDPANDNTARLRTYIQVRGERQSALISHVSREDR